MRPELGLSARQEPKKKPRHSGASDDEEAHLLDPRSDAAEAAGGRSTLFQFAYRSVPFRVVLAARDGASLQAEVGTLPFTVDGGTLRHDMLTLLDRVRRTAGYQVAIARDHGISLSVALSVDGTTPPASILAAALEGLASAKPWLDHVLTLLPTHLRRFPEIRSQDAA